MEPKTIVRDNDYYLETVIFLVENCLFKVPRYYFAQHSEIFRMVFSLPPGAEGVEGDSDSKPFRLDGVQEDDFRNLLTAIYPQNPFERTTMSTSQWMSVLNLSTMWSFIDLRKRAVEELSKPSIIIDPIERVLLAKVHKIPHWLIQGYTELVRRSETISVAEATRLGIETSVHLLHIREQLAPFADSNGNFYGPRSLRDNQCVNELTEHIKSKFQAELTEIGAASDDYAPDAESSHWHVLPSGTVKSTLPQSHRRRLLGRRV